MVILKSVLLLAVLLILFAVYEIIGLFKKKAITYYLIENGDFYPFGDTVFSISADSYLFHDDNQPSSNRFQGNSNVEDGFAVVHLRNDPSSSDLTLALHKEGWVDLDGNIYEKSGLRVGYITDEKGRPGINGSGRWYELWLKKHAHVYTCSGGDGPTQGLLIGKVVETGRIGKAKPNKFTTTARAGGFIRLYKDCQPKPESEDSMADRYTWRDTALPATVLFTFIYGLFFLAGMGKMTFPALGEQIGFTASMLLVFLAIWAILRQIKIEASLEGKAFDEFLMLIDRNTGVGGLNNWIILTASAALVVSMYIYGSDFVPLQAAILIGTWVNRKYITREPWKISDVNEDEETRLPEWDEGDGDNPDETPPLPDDADTPDTENEHKMFRWRLDSSYHQLNGELEVSFSSEKIAALRASNPFHLNPHGSFKENITELIGQCKDNRKVHEVLRYIDNQAHNKGLGEMERMQFILDFVQMPNIGYEFDEKCEEIGNPREYARYPDETMYDGRGDCDCKAVLAAILFREAGHKTAYLVTNNHAAVAVAFRNKLAPELVNMAGQSLVTKDGYLYFFCETTGDGFKIGDLGGTTKEAVKDIFFLN